MAEGDNNSSRERPLAEVARLLKRSRGFLAGELAAGMPGRSVPGPRGTSEWRLDPAEVARWLEQRAVEQERERLAAKYQQEIERLRKALERAGSEDDGEITWAEARRRRMLAEARLTELDLAEREHRTVDWEQACWFLRGAIVQTRQAIMYAPGKVAVQVAAERDPVKVQKILAAEFRAVLHEADASLRRWLEKLQKAGGPPPRVEEERDEDDD